MRSPELESGPLSACSWTARKKGPMPVPASSGNPKVLTIFPRSPVRSAWSKFETAARNCGELRRSAGSWKESGSTYLTIRRSASSEGGTGRSGGRWGKRVGISSG